MPDQLLIEALKVLTLNLRRGLAQIAGADAGVRGGAGQGAGAGAGAGAALGLAVLS
jgi:hypothetical protein